MNKHNQKSSAKPTTAKAAAKSEHHGLDAVDEVLPEGSWQRTAAGVGAAAGGGLLAAALVGVGPAAIAGAAGYVAYRGLTGHGKDEHDESHKN